MLPSEISAAILLAMQLRWLDHMLFLNSKNAAFTFMLGTKTTTTGASLVAQWLRIRLPIQGTRVPALVREDPTCRGATKPVCHNY